MRVWSHSTTSSCNQPTDRADSLTGAGKEWSLISRYSVARDKPHSCSTSRIRIRRHVPGMVELVSILCLRVSAGVLDKLELHGLVSLMLRFLDVNAIENLRMV